MLETLLTIFLALITNNTDNVLASKFRVYYDRFQKEKEKYKSFYNGHEEELDNHFISSILNIMVLLNPDKIKFSLTDSESIFFTISVSDFEISFEVFYTKESNEDNIEVVYTVYYGDALISQESSESILFAVQKIKVLINSYLNQQSVSRTLTSSFSGSMSTATNKGWNIPADYYQTQLGQL